MQHYTGLRRTTSSVPLEPRHPVSTETSPAPGPQRLCWISQKFPTLLEPPFSVGSSVNFLNNFVSSTQAKDYTKKLGYILLFLEIAAISEMGDVGT